MSSPVLHTLPYLQVTHPLLKHPKKTVKNSGLAEIRTQSYQDDAIRPLIKVWADTVPELA